MQIEEIYHALALGEVNPAIVLAAVALKGNLAIWEAVLEAVAQAPTTLMPQDTALFADVACHKATQQYDAISAVASVVLYTWLLTASSGDAL